MLAFQAGASAFVHAAFITRDWEVFNEALFLVCV